MSRRIIQKKDESETADEQKEAKVILNQKKSETNTLKKESEQLSGDLKSMGEEIKELAPIVRKLKETKISLEKKIEKLGKNKEAAEADISEKQNELIDIAKDVTKASANAEKDAKNKVLTENSRLENIKKDISEAEDHILIVRADTNALEFTFGKLKKQITDKQNAISLVKTRQIVNKGKLDTIKKDIKAEEKKLEKTKWLASKEKALATSIEIAENTLAGIIKKQMDTGAQIEKDNIENDNRKSKLDKRQKSLKVFEELLKYKELKIKKIGKTYQKYLNEAGISIDIGKIID